MLFFASFSACHSKEAAGNPFFAVRGVVLVVLSLSLSVLLFQLASPFGCLLVRRCPLLVAAARPEQRGFARCAESEEESTSAQHSKRKGDKHGGGCVERDVHEKSSQQCHHPSADVWRHRADSAAFRRTRQPSPRRMRSSLSVLQSTSSSKALAAPRVHSRHTATYSALRVSHPSRAVTCRGGMTSSGTNNFFARRTPATGGAGGAAAMHSSAAASTSAARSSPGRLAALFSSAGSSSWASSDLRAYHDRYPGQRQHAGSNKNLLFYTNQIVSVPSGAKIDTMHATWFGQHDLLEAHHGYIQWIFPSVDLGMHTLRRPRPCRLAVDGSRSIPLCSAV